MKTTSSAPESNQPAARGRGNGLCSRVLFPGMKMARSWLALRFGQRHAYRAWVWVTLGLLTLDAWQSAQAQSIQDITPAEGGEPGGTPVVLTGSGFYVATGVLFGATPARFKVLDDNHILATSPALAGDVHVAVTFPWGEARLYGKLFKVYPNPTATGISPAYGPAPGGNTVTITGSRLSFVGSVSYGSVTIPSSSFTSIGGDHITFAAPNGSGTVQVSLHPAWDSSVTFSSLSYDYVGLEGSPSVIPVRQGVDMCSAPITPNHGVAPYTYTITSGSLPDGIFLFTFLDSFFLNGATEAPVGNYPVTVTATDAASQTVSRTYNLYVWNTRAASSVSLQVALDPLLISPIFGVGYNALAFDETAVFTASVTAPSAPGWTPSGTVTFKQGEMALQTVPLVNGQAVCQTTALTHGTNTVTAIYSGDECARSSSGALPLPVLPAASFVYTNGDYWMGEDDGAKAGDLVVATVSAPPTPGAPWPSSLVHRSEHPVYSTNVAARAAEKGSRMSITFGGSQVLAQEDTGWFLEPRKVGIEVWVKPTQNTAFALIAAVGSFYGPYSASGIGFMQEGGYFKAYLGYGSDVDRLGAAPIKLNEWMHLALVRVHGEYKFYIDGLVAASTKEGFAINFRRPIPLILQC